jgi:hypothetical protein
MCRAIRQVWALFLAALQRRFRLGLQALNNFNRETYIKLQSLQWASGL